MTALAADVWSHWSLGRALGSPAGVCQTLAAAGYGAAVLADWENLNGAVSWVQAAENCGLVPLVGVTVPVAVPGFAAGVRIVARAAQAWGLLCRIAAPAPPREWEVLDDPDLLWLVPAAPAAPHPRQSPAWMLVDRADRVVPPGWDAVAALPVRFREEADRTAWEVLRRMGPDADRAAGGPPASAASLTEHFGASHPAIASWGDVIAAVEPRVLPPPPLRLSFREERRCARAEASQGTADAELAALAEAGLAERMGRGARPPAPYPERLQHELTTIASLGFADYFLVVADLVAEARQRGIAVGPGRGSAAASLVAFALGITDLDPLRYGLVFERFLNPHRSSPPDIDLDIEDTRRAELVAYLQERYGAERVAQIGTYSTLGPRAALRETARVLGVPGAELQAALTGRSLDEKPGWRQVAARLEGTPHHASVHAAGVVIAPAPIADWSPVVRHERQAVTGLDMHALAALGLVKFDLLGLRTLTALAEAVRLAPHLPPLAAVPPQDADTCRLLSQGDTEGVFQLDGRGVRDLLRSMQPESLEDVILAVALYRPGPMEQIGEYLRRRRRGFQPATPLERLLADTLGILVFQEQLMAVAREFAGYDWAEADLFRRAVSKKDGALLAAERRRFVEGVHQRRGRAVDAEALWQQVVPFAQYGFNRAHAAAYGLLAYYAAYVKAHAPAAFWAGEMAARAGEGTAGAALAAMREGVRLLPPHVNASDWGPSLEPGPEEPGIRLGLSAVRGLPREWGRALVRDRPVGGYRQVAELRAGAAGGVGLEVLVQTGCTEGLAGSGGGAADQLQFGFAAPARPARERAAPWPRADGRVYVQVERADASLVQRVAACAAASPGSAEVVLVERDRRQGRRAGIGIAPSAAARRRLLAVPGILSVVMGVVAPTTQENRGGA